MIKSRHKPYFRLSDLTESRHTASYIIQILDATGKSLVEVVNEQEDFFHVCACLTNDTKANGYFCILSISHNSCRVT